MQRNMSWAGYERALPPEMIPHRLFDRLFGAREEGWVNRKRSILDTVRADASALEKSLPTDDKARVDEHLSGIRDLERSIAGLPPEYARVDPPDFDGDMKDWPRIAKLQSDLAGAGARDAPDARGFLHVDEMPEPDAVSVAWLYLGAPS